MASSGSSEMAPAGTKRAAVQASVLRATEDLLAAGATYADLNIERIATRAGISRTAFYFYFRDKRELLLRLTEELNEQLYEQADIWFSGDGEPEAEMRAALTNVAALYAEHAPLVRATVEVSTYDEGVARFWRGLVARFVTASSARIAAERPTGDAEATAYALCWMTERALFQQMLEPEAVSADALVEALTGIWLRSVYGS
jgi:TetR/AcrR family transcriptional regulator, ethionamide resistance regulator